MFFLIAPFLSIYQFIKNYNENGEKPEYDENVFLLFVFASDLSITPKER